MLLLLRLALLGLGLASAAGASPYYVPYPTAWQDSLSARVCVGLFNREPFGGAYLYQNASSDATWLELLENVTNPTLTPHGDFIAACFAGPAAGRYIPYDPAQQEVLPMVITLAAVLDAVPIDVGASVPAGATTLAFDAVTAFKGRTAAQATEEVFDLHVNATTGLCKLNPGYEGQGGKAVLHPNITRPPTLGLVDFVVKQRLFNMYLPEGCVPLTSDHKVMEKVAGNNPWPKPIAVWGYDETVVVFGGDFFEAETLCVGSAGMGQIASQGFANLGYFSRAPARTTPLPVNSPALETYNASRTYIAFLVGDGDNMDYLKDSRHTWIEERLTRCNGTACPYPLLWTMNPHTLSASPGVAEWYAQQLLVTETDTFALPPSGDLYAYPSMFTDAEQATFVANTERDCTLLGTSVITAWEFALHWTGALKNYFPRYAANGIVKASVTVNVPYSLPTTAFGSEFYTVAGGASVVFKPHEWRGTRGHRGPVIPFGPKTDLNISMMAKTINGYAPGTVTPIYLTSDGGGNLGNIDDLVQALAEHVSVVGQEIGDLALERDRGKKKVTPVDLVALESV